MKVHVKWNKEIFKDVEVDLSQPPLVFKGQLFALSGVPPDRQKVMVKGGLLKDDEWGKAVPKDGQTLMMMGTADPISTEAPKDIPVFVEDLPEKEQASYGMKKFGKGLTNLGNTCYMNSTLQCLYKVPQLRSALLSFSAPPTPASRLLVSARDLFKELAEGGEPMTPYLFLLALRDRFPQFSQTTPQGIPMQQDAEECWTQLLYSLREGFKGSGSSNPVEEAFGVQLKTRLVCEETQEEMLEESTNYMLKCNIAADTNFLAQGLRLGLKEDREKNSTALGRLALFQGSSAVARLPPVLTVQMVRFFYKADVQQKAKILRKVTYPLELDMYEFCSPELQAQLEGPRAKAKEIEDKLVEEKKTKKAKADNGAAASGSGADAEAKDGASTSAADGAITGKYELTGVLTHKGRSADSGHYVAWVKQDDGQWVLYDDDQLHFKKEEDILALSGGGDWHMAYLLLYRAKTVPMGQGEASSSKAAEAAAAAGAAEAMETEAS